MGKIAKYGKICVIISSVVFLAAMAFMAISTNAIFVEEGVPVLSNPIPANGSINVALNPTLSIYVSDPDGDDMDVTINVTNADGGYQSVTYYDVGNGTYTYALGHMNTYGKTYYWNVSVSDGYYYVTATYHFTTIGLVVNLNTTQEYHTIQDAINDANDGNIIVVHNGTYMENVVVNKSVTLINGSKPLVDGMGGTAFNITADNVSIVGFNITNSTYGVYCDGYSGFYIANNTFTWNFYSVYANNSNLYEFVIFNNTILNATWQGISLHNSTFGHVINNTFNQSYYGYMGDYSIINAPGGIMLYNCNYTDVFNNTVNGSYTMGGVGIGIYNLFFAPIEPCYNTIYNNTISASYYSILLYATDNETVIWNNITDAWHGIYLIYSENISIFNNTLVDIWGNGITLEDSRDNRVMWNNISAYPGEGGGGGETYTIYVKQNGEWKEIKKIHLNKPYSMVTLPLTDHLPDSDGEYKVRISQHGGVAAHMDYVAIRDNGYHSPSFAAYLDDGGSILSKIMEEDKDVASMWGRTVEIKWDGQFSSPVLVMKANEEHHASGVPYLTPHPMLPSLMDSYIISNNGAIDVDGMPDELGSPDFSAFWVPGTGHPPGYTYLWLRSDGEYLYAAMEVTGDNTYDEDGWGAIYIYNGDEVKEFRVDSNHEYGMDGFVYTDAVEWQHMYYEFKIPLDEIGADTGSQIKIGFGSYGTLSPPTPEHNGILVYSYGPPFARDNYISFNNVYNFSYGITLSYVLDNHMAFNYLYNNTFGIYDTYVGDTTFVGDIVSESGAYAFYSDENCYNVSIYYMTLASYPTTISFIYGNGIAINGTEEPHPSDMIPIGKYLEIYPVTTNSWINLTIHYEDSEVYGVNEYDLALYHWNGSASEWESVEADLNTFFNEINANLTSFSEYGVFATEMNVSIHLFNPWNLITVPINNTYTASSLGAAIDGCMVITRWDAEKQRYHDYIVGINTPGNPDFDIEDGVAYFVGVRYPTWFNMTGQPIENISIALKPGLNAIGWTGIANTTAEDFGGDINKCVYVVKWNETSQEFETHMVGTVSNDNFTMETGRGVFVYIEGSSDVMWYGRR